MNADSNTIGFFEKGDPKRGLTFQEVPEYDVTIVDDYIRAGWLLAEMDKAAGLRARSYTGERTVTRLINSMSFDKPVRVGNVVQIFTEVVNQGRSSLKLKVEVWTKDIETGVYQQVTEGLFTFVAVSENRNPVDIATGQEITGRPRHAAQPDGAPRGKPGKSVLMTDRDRNTLGDIFGGRVLAVMDEAAAADAHEYTRREVATRGIKEMEFRKPVLSGDNLMPYVEVMKTGNTSVTMNIEIWAQRKDGENEKLTEGQFTYVALDENRKPVSIHPQS